MNTLLIKGKDEYWHLREYGCKETPCGEEGEYPSSIGHQTIEFDRLNKKCEVCERLLRTWELSE